MVGKSQSCGEKNSGGRYARQGATFVKALRQDRTQYA